MQAELICPIISVHDESGLLAVVRSYGRLRTYPGATDRHQADLHRRLVGLAGKGRVRQVAADATSVLWEASQ